MSRIDNREADERSLIAILPGLNDDAREKVFTAVTHSRRWSKDAYGKAKAAIMACRQAELPVPVAVEVPGRKSTYRALMMCCLIAFVCGMCVKALQVWIWGAGK